MEALSLAAVALLAFAATNVDNLLLLVAITSRPQQSFAAVLLGVALWTGTLLTLSTAAAYVADFAPQRWLGALGLIPLGLGIRELLRMRATRKQSARPEPGPSASGSPIGAGAVAGIMLANSADSFGALVPVFAETREALLVGAAGAVFLASLGGCGAARWIAGHPRLGPRIRRLGPRLVPFALIAVGIYVISNTATDTAPGY